MKKLWLQNKKLIRENNIPVRCRNCPCELDLCDLALDSAGGDEGYVADFPLKRTSYDTPLSIRFATYTIKDQLVICADPLEPYSGTASAAAISGTVLYDSGCISTTSDPDYERVTLPKETKVVRIIVIPNCEGTRGTAWALKVICCCPCTPENMASCCPCYDKYLLWKDGRLDDYRSGCCPYLKVNG